MMRRRLAATATVAAFAIAGFGCAGTEGDGDVLPADPLDALPSGTVRQVVNPTVVLPKTTAPEAAPEGAPWPDPAITKFELSAPEECTGEDGTMTATYETTGADRVVFVVDDVQLDQPIPTSGTHLLPISCGQMTHFVLMIAANPANVTATERRTNIGH